MSPVPDCLAWAVDALSLPWEALDPSAFPSVAILGKVVAKLRKYPCRRKILIAKRWPNMIRFWDLVAMSSQIPLCFLNLLTQPFNQIQPKSPCLTPRALAIKKQGFFEAVAARIEALQRAKKKILVVSWKHRDRPEGLRGIPSWNPSLVLHQLTKAPFEALKQAS